MNCSETSEYKDSNRGSKSIRTVLRYSGSVKNFVKNNKLENKVILHPRKGNYSGMPVQRNLKIVKMDPTSKDGKIVKEIVYNGEKQIIKL